jgi:ribonuclease HI
MDLKELLLKTPKKSLIKIFTDITWDPVTSIGEWHFHVKTEIGHVSISGTDSKDSSNQLTILCAIKALENIPHGYPILFHSKSSYLRNGLTKWRHGWKENGWQSSSSKPIKNIELWQELDQLCDGRDIKCENPYYSYHDYKQFQKPNNDPYSGKLRHRLYPESPMQRSARIQSYIDDRKQKSERNRPKSTKTMVRPIV